MYVCHRVQAILVDWSVALKSFSKYITRNIQTIFGFTAVLKKNFFYIFLIGAIITINDPIIKGNLGHFM